MRKSDFILPSYLFYGDKTLDNSAKSPSGEIDIDKALKGDDSCWIDESSSSKQEKKIIILDLSNSADNQDLINLFQENKFVVMYPDEDRVLQTLRPEILPIYSNKSECGTHNEIATIMPPAGRRGKGEDLFDSIDLKDKSREEVIIINDKNLSGIRADMRITDIAKKESKYVDKNIEVKLKKSGISIRANMAENGEHMSAGDLDKIINQGKTKCLQYREEANEGDELTGAEGHADSGDKTYLDKIKIPESVEHLRIDATYKSMQKWTHSSNFANSCKNLRSLRIDSPVSDTVLFDILKNSPNLISVDLQGGVFSLGGKLDFSSIDIPNLTGMNIEFPSKDICAFDFVRAAKNLNILSVDCKKNPHAIIEVRDSLKNHENIENLSIKYIALSGTNEANAYGTLFFIPSLKKFTYHGDAMKPYKRISVPTAQSYLRRNGPENLEELRCESEECQWYLDTAFKPLMKSCQKIRSMHILDREYNNYPIASAENGTLKHSNIANEKGTIKGMRSELFQIDFHCKPKGEYYFCEEKLDNFRSVEKAEIAAHDGLGFTLPSSDSVKKLNIFARNLPSRMKVKNDISLSNLVSLDIENCSFSLNDLARILNSAKHLENLYIDTTTTKIVPNERDEAQIPLNENALKNLYNIECKMNESDIASFKDMVDGNLTEKCTTGMPKGHQRKFRPNKTNNPGFDDQFLTYRNGDYIRNSSQSMAKNVATSQSSHYSVPVKYTGRRAVDIPEDVNIDVVGRGINGVIGDGSRIGHNDGDGYIADGDGYGSGGIGSGVGSDRSGRGGVVRGSYGGVRDGGGDASHGNAGEISALSDFEIMMSQASKMFAKEEDEQKAEVKEGGHKAKITKSRFDKPESSYKQMSKPPAKPVDKKDGDGKIKDEGDTKGKESSKKEGASDNSNQENHELGNFFQPPKKYEKCHNFTQQIARMRVVEDPVTIKVGENGDPFFTLNPSLKTKDKCVNRNVKFTTEKEIKEIHEHPDAECFKVEIQSKFEHIEGDGIPMPAFSTNDQIGHISLNCDGTKIDEKDFSIMYCDDIDQYVLFCNNEDFVGKNIDITYLVTPPKEKVAEVVKNHRESIASKSGQIKDAEVQKMIIHASQFKIGELNEIKDEAGKDITQELIDTLWNVKSGGKMEATALLHAKIAQKTNGATKARICSSFDGDSIEIQDNASKKWISFSFVNRYKSKDKGEEAHLNGGESYIAESVAKLAELLEKKSASKDEMDEMKQLFDEISDRKDEAKEEFNKKANELAEKQSEELTELLEKKDKGEEVDAEIIEKLADSVKKFEIKKKKEAEMHAAKGVGFGKFDVWRDDVVYSPNELINKLSPILKEDGKPNTLIACSSQAQIAGVRCCLMDSFKKSGGVKYHVIDSPDALRFALVTISNNKNEIEVRSKSEGELYEFLTQELGETKVLLVDWSNFSAQEILQCNSILDADPKLEGKSLNKVKVVSLQNLSSPSAYLGEDFFSRHQRTINVPTEVDFDLRLKSELVESENVKNDPYIIDLKNTKNGMVALNGTCMLNGNVAVWKEGRLIQAMKSGKDIMIQNAPKVENGTEYIRRFLEDAQREGEMKVHGKKFKIGDNVKITFSETESEISALDIKSVATFTPRKPTENDVYINPNTFTQLKEICHIDENGNAITEAGFIEQYKGKVLPICISAEISSYQWSDLIAMANENNVKLDITVDKLISLPFDLEDREKYESRGNADCSKIIMTNDVGFTLNSLVESSKSAAKDSQKDDSSDIESDTIFIDSSEITNDNLLFSVSNRTHFGKDGCKFKFSISNGALTNAILNGKHVCIYGDINENLLSDLSSIFAGGIININGKAVKVTGKLTIVTDKNLNMICDETQNVSAEDKKQALIRKYGEKYINIPQKDIEQNNFNRLSAFLRNGKSDFADTWKDLTISTNEMMPYNDDIKLDSKSTAKITKEFEEERMSSVINALNTNPLVCVVGVAGTGKTTFFESEEFADKADVFTGLESVKDWVKSRDTDNSGKVKVLYLDEANIGGCNYSFFNGLFVNNDIIVDGVAYKLTKQHKVVFAANPDNYSKTRKTPDIVMQHGGVIKFKEIPLEAIYNDVMKSIFQPFVDDADEIFWSNVANIILKIYQKTNAISKAKSILTPRSLQAACQSLRSLADESILNRKDTESPNEDIGTAYFGRKDIHDILRMNMQFSIPKEHRADFLSILDKEFNTDSEINVPTQTIEKLAARGFYVTDSNKDLLIAVDNVLKLRDWKVNAGHEQALTSVKNKPVRRYGGTCGLVVESQPGCGKSATVRLMMEMRNFRELNLEDFDTRRADQLTREQRARGFIVMPNQATLSQKEEILHWAFDNGITIVWDEFNSIGNAPLEKSLNAYFCGKDIHGIPAKNAGFCVIATQNNAKNFTGRFELSDATLSRVMGTSISEHNDEELARITKSINPKMSDSEIEIRIEQYRNAQRHAEINGLTMPNFRVYLSELGAQISKAEPVDPNQINQKREEDDLVGLPEPEIKTSNSQAEAMRKKLRHSMANLSKKWIESSKLGAVVGDPAKKQSRLQVSRKRISVSFDEGSKRIEYNPVEESDKFNYNPNALPPKHNIEFLKNINPKAADRLIAIFGFKNQSDFAEKATHKDLRTLRLAVMNSEFETVDLSRDKNELFEAFFINLTSKSKIDINKMNESEYDEMVQKLIKEYDEYSYSCYQIITNGKDENADISNKCDDIMKCLTEVGHNANLFGDTNKLIKSVANNNLSDAKDAANKNKEYLNEYCVYQGSNALILSAIKLSMKSSANKNEAEIMKLLLSQPNTDLQARNLSNGMTALHIAYISGNLWLANELLNKNPECANILDFAGKRADAYLGISYEEAKKILDDMIPLYGEKSEANNLPSKDEWANQIAQIAKIKSSINTPKHNNDTSLVLNFIVENSISRDNGLTDEVKNKLTKIITDVSNVNQTIDTDYKGLKSGGITMLASLCANGCNPHYNQQLSELFKTLRNRKSNVNDQSNISKSTAMHLAASNGRNNAVKLLLDTFSDKINYSAKDASGNNFAHIILMNGYVDRDGTGDYFAKDDSCSSTSLLKQIITLSPEIINDQMSDGNTLLHIAIMRRDIEAVELLLQNGADRTILNKAGISPAGMINMEYEEVKQYLQANTTAPNLNNSTYLKKNISANIKNLLRNYGMEVKSDFISAEEPKIKAATNSKETKPNNKQAAEIKASDLKDSEPAKADADTAKADANISTKADAAKADTAVVNDVKTAELKESATKADSVKAEGAKVDEVKPRNPFTRVKFYGERGMISVYKSFIENKKDEKVGVIAKNGGKVASDRELSDIESLKKKTSQLIMDAVCDAKDKHNLTNERAMYILKIARDKGGVGNLDKDVITSLGIKASDIRFSSEVQKNMNQTKLSKACKILSPKDSETLMRTKRLIDLYDMVNFEDISFEESLNRLSESRSKKTPNITML